MAHRPSSSQSPGQPARASKALRVRRRFIAAVISAMLAPAGAWAQGLAAANSATQVTIAPNGVPVVNIAVPNASGLSHNRYLQFNVDGRGAVLNNAANQPFVQTQLAGQVVGNINLPRAASLILNEVVAPGRSTLAGFLEIAGSPAHLVIANPSGITCSGCGFIQTPRVTLSTGTPMLDATTGALRGLRVGSGDVLVTGAGLDARNPDYLDIVARSIRFEAPVHAQDLQIVAGANDWDVQTGAVTPNAASGAAPGRALDSTVLGGLYANRIRILATESGVGVRMLGDAAASANDFILSASGHIELQGKITASHGNVAVLHQGPASDGAGSGTNAIVLGPSGGLDAGGQVALATTATGAGILLQGGTLRAGGDLVLRSAGALADSGSVTVPRFAAGSLDIDVAGTASLDGAAWGAGGSVDIVVGGLQVGAGGATLYSGSSAPAASRSLTLTATQGTLALGAATLQSPGAITLSAGTDIRSSGRIVAGGDLALSGQALANTGMLLAQGALRVAATQLDNAGTLQGGSALEITTGALTNQSTGLLLTAGQAGAALVIQADRLQNAGTVQSVGTLDITAADGILNSATGRVWTLSTIDGGSAGDLRLVSATTLANAGTLQSAGDLQLQVGTGLQNLGTARIAGAGDVAITGLGADFALDNAGRIEAATLLALGENTSRAAIDNTGTLLAGRLAVDASTLRNAGTLQAADGASIRGTSLHNAGANAVLLTSTSGLGAGTLQFSGAILNEGVIDAKGALQLAAASLDNAAGAGIASQATLVLDMGVGDIDNAGALYGGTGLQATAHGLHNSTSGASLFTGGNLRLSLGEAAELRNSGRIEALGAMTVTGAGQGTDLVNTGQLLAHTLDWQGRTLHNTGTLQAANGARITGTSLHNEGAGAVLLTSTTGNGAGEITLSGSAVNEGHIEGRGRLALQAASLQNAAGAGIASQAGLLLDTGAGTIDNSGALYSGQDLQLRADSLVNRRVGSTDALLQSAGAMQLTLSTGQLLDNAGRIEAGGALHIGDASHAADLRNSGTLVAGTLEISTGTLTNSGMLQAANGATIRGTVLTNQGQDATILGSTTGNGASLLDFTGAATNEGAIHGNGALTLRAASITNSSTGGISSLGDLALDAGSGNVDNRGALYGGQDLLVQALNFRNLGTSNTSNGEVYVERDARFVLDGGLFENSNTLHAGRDIAIRAKDFRNVPVGGMVTVIDGPLMPVNPDANNNPAAVFIDESGGIHCDTLGNNCAYNSIYEYRYARTQSLSTNDPVVAGKIIGGRAFTLEFSGTAQNQASLISAPRIDIIGTGSGPQTFTNASIELYRTTYTHRYRNRHGDSDGFSDFVPLTEADYNNPMPAQNYENNWAAIQGPVVCVDFFGTPICGPTLPSSAQVWDGIRSSYLATGPSVTIAPGNGAGLYADAALGIQGNVRVVNRSGTNTGRDGAANDILGRRNPDDIAGAGTGDGSYTGQAGSAQPGSSGSRRTGQQATAGNGATQFATGVGIAGLNLGLPTNPNGIFVTRLDPQARYLVETNPRFAAGSPYGSSDYLAQLLGFNPELQLKRLGDGSYEARLVREQLIAQTGNLLLAGFDTEARQMRGLMESAAAQAGALGLRFGSPLSAEQVAGLTQDMVWMVEQTVAGQRVLAPVVYLSRATQVAVLTGAVIAARDIRIAGQGLENTGGSIVARNNLQVSTTGDITNTSGTVRGGNVALQSTEGSIRNETAATFYGDDLVGQTQIGRQATISATSNLQLDAAQDITLRGASLAAGGDASLRAGGNVVVDTVENRTATTTFRGASGFLTDSSTSTNVVTVRQQASGIDVGNNLRIDSGGDITIAGSRVAAGGDAALQAAGNLNLLARNDSTTTTTRSSASGIGVGGGIGGTQTTTTVNTDTISVASSITSGGNTRLGAGQTLTVVGSDVAADGNLDLAARDIRVLSGENSQETRSRTETTTLNLTAEANADRVGVGANVKMETTDSYNLETQARGSTLSAGGNVTRTAINSILDRGTAIAADGNVTQSAASIQSLAAENRSVATSSTSTTTIGYGVGVNLQAGQAYDGAKSAVQNADPTQIAQPNVNVGVDITYNRTDTNSASTESRAVVSTIRAGGNVSSSSSGTTVLQGTAVNADGNVRLQAGDLQVTAARDTRSTTSGQQTIDAALSLTYNGSVGGSVSGGYGTASSESASSNAVVGSIRSGGNLTLDATNDVRLEGTQLASGGSTTIAGNNVRIDAAQSTASASSSSMDVSASISVSKGTGKSSGDKAGGVEASYSESSSNSASSSSTAGTIAAGGNVSIVARTGDVALQGTGVTAGQDIAVSAARNVDLSAAVDTASSNASSLSISGSVAGGKSKNDDGTKNTSGSGGGQFASGSSNSQSETRTGGSLTTGGNLAITSGGNTRLEGTQVQAAAAQLEVGGNLKMESAVSTSSGKSNNLGVGVSVSSDSLARQKPGRKPPTKEGPVSAYGSVDLGSSSRDTRTNQNTAIQVGKLDAKVGGNLTQAGVTTRATQQNVAVKGQTAVEKRTDMDSGSSSAIKVRGGVTSGAEGDKKADAGNKAKGTAVAKADPKKPAAKPVKKPGAAKPGAKPEAKSAAGTKASVPSTP